MDDQTTLRNPAETYQAYMVPTLFQPWSVELLSRLGISPGERVLDVACGTGVVARGAATMAGPEGTVAGVDISPHMLAVARDVPVEDSAAPITWHEGRGENLPFDDHVFDVVTCQQGLQFFTDRLAGVREMHRVLKPGGRAGVAVWRGPEHQFVKGALLLALQRWFGPGALIPYSFGDADALRSLFLDAGFDDVNLEVVRRQNHTPSVDEFIAITIRAASAAVPVLARATDKERADAAASIRQEIAEEISAVQVGEGLEYPMESHILLARA